MNIEKNGLYSLYAHCGQLMEDRDRSTKISTYYKSELSAPDYIKAYNNGLDDDLAKIKKLSDEQVQVLKDDKEIVVKFAFVQRVVHVAEKFFVYTQKPEKANYYSHLQEELVKLQLKIPEKKNEWENPALTDVHRPEDKKVIVDYLPVESKRTLKKTLYCLVDIPKSFSRFLGEIGSTLFWAAKDMVLKSVIKGYDDGGLVKAFIRLASSTFCAAVGVVATVFISTFYSLPKKLCLSLYGIYKPESWVQYKRVDGKVEEMETRLDGQSNWIVKLWNGLEKTNKGILDLMGVVDKPK